MNWWQVAWALIIAALLALAALLNVIVWWFERKDRQP